MCISLSLSLYIYIYKHITPIHNRHRQTAAVTDLPAPRFGFGCCSVQTSNVACREKIAAVLRGGRRWMHGAKQQMLFCLKQQQVVTWSYGEVCDDIGEHRCVLRDADEGEGGGRDRGTRGARGNVKHARGMRFWRDDKSG